MAAFFVWRTAMESGCCRNRAAEGWCYAKFTTEASERVSDAVNVSQRGSVAAYSRQDEASEQAAQFGWVHEIFFSIVFHRISL